jgi:hypothetical protein
LLSAAWRFLRSSSNKASGTTLVSMSRNLLASAQV